MSVQDTERVIKNFAETTLDDLKAQSDLTQYALSEQIQEIQKFFIPDVEDDTGEVDPGDNIVTINNFRL